MDLHTQTEEVELGPENEIKNLVSKKHFHFYYYAVSFIGIFKVMISTKSAPN